MHNSGKDMFKKCLLTFLLLFCAMPIIVNASAGDSIVFDNFDSDSNEALDNIVNSDVQLEVSEDEYNIHEYLFSENLIENTLSTVLYGAVGMQGFFGDYEINDPHETVEVVVQFVTPPAVALRLLQEEERRFGSAPAVDFDEEALVAHTTFLHQLSQIQVPFFRRHIVPQIFSQHHQLFNGVYMRISGGLVEQIANLPEVYAVFPHVLPKIPEAVNHFDIDVIQSEPEIISSDDNIRVVLLDTGIDHTHPELNRYLDETGRIPGWQYFYEPGTERDHGTQTANGIVSVSPEIELWSIQKGTNCGPGVVSIAALETAVKLGADVIYTFGTNEHPHATAVSLAVLDGHNVVTAADTPHAYVSYTFDWGVEDVDNLEGEVRYNTPPSLPSLGDIPSNPGYRFNGWTPVVGSITEDTIFEARWKESYIAYTFDWGVEDVDNPEGRIRHSDTPTEPSDEDIPENIGYKFDGWSPEVDSITADTTFEAIWKPIYISYTFEWDLEDVNSLEGKAVYNTTPPSLPSLGDIPSNPGYRFDGWTPPVGLITEETVFQARWIPADVSYTFDWDVEGVNNLNGEIEHNTVPTVPSRESVPENPGYQFNGWEPRVGPVTESTTFKAIWIPKYVEYTFDWRLDSVDNPSDKTRDDSLPNLPSEIPENPGYQFNGWTPLIEPLSENTIFNAVWIPVDQDDYAYLTYTFDWGLANTTNPKGLARYDTTPATPGAVPNNPGYAFDGWSPRVDSIVEDTIFTATWVPSTEEIEDDWYELVATIEPADVYDNPVEVDEDDLDDGELDENDLDDDELDESDLDNDNLDEYDLEDVELDETDLDNDELDENDLDDNELDESNLDDGELDESDLDNNDLNEDDLDNDELGENDMNDDSFDMNDNELDENNLNDDYLNEDDQNNYTGENDLNDDDSNNQFLSENDDDEANDYIGEDNQEENPIFEAPRPGSRARPTLPQTGAIAGVSVLAGTSLATSGLVIASAKNKLMQNKLVQKRTSLNSAALDQQLEEEYGELFGN